MTSKGTRIREEILAQHRALRTQLTDLRREAGRAVRGHPGEAGDLPGMLAALVRSLGQHMAFENEHLMPLLRGRNPAGQWYATLLAEEHASQHEELQAMARQAADPDDLTSLALAIAAFAGDVLRDMDDEELQFLTPPRLADDGVDQQTERRVGR
jgi:iron-sulfur cluster repair protein YtfE (RIC family)